MGKMVERIMIIEKNTNTDNNKYINRKYAKEKRSFNGHSISDKTPQSYKRQTLTIGHDYQ